MNWISTVKANHMSVTQSELDARASIAGDLYREGEITRSECFRLEMDAVLGDYTGPVDFKVNTEYVELLAMGGRE